MENLLPDEVAQRRVNQIYRSYLDVVFKVEAYKEVFENKIWKTRAFDFTIGFSSVLSGGSGLGILGDARLAWVCGIVTACSVILTVLKSVWPWPDELKDISKKIEDYSIISAKYNTIIEKVNAFNNMNIEDSKIYDDIKSQHMSIKPDNYSISDKKKLKIQNDIKTRIQYKNWWNWQ